MEFLKLYYEISDRMNSLINDIKRNWYQSLNLNIKDTETKEIINVYDNKLNELIEIIDIKYIKHIFKFNYNGYQYILSNWHNDITRINQKTGTKKDITLDTYYKNFMKFINRIEKLFYSDTLRHFYIYKEEGEEKAIEYYYNWNGRQEKEISVNEIIGG